MNNKKKLTSENLIRVAILEDNVTLTKGMQAELDKEDIHVCAINDKIDIFLEHVKSCQPEVAIVDLRIWGDFEAGFSSIQKVREICPNTKFIIYTGYDKIENFHKGINLGVRAFVSKNIYEKPLDEVVRIVASGGTYYGEFLSEYLEVIREDPAQLQEKPVDVNPSQPIWTNKELEILNHLDNGLTPQQIAEILVVTANTIKAHTKSIRAKLNVGTTAEAIRAYRLLRAKKDG